MSAMLIELNKYEM